jgi:microcystin degradation protein MlrC
VSAINVTSVRAANVGTAHVNYVNQSVPGAATSVPRGTFVSAHPVIAAARPLSVDAVRQARVVGTAPPITPSRESIVVKSRGHFRTGFLPWFPPEQVIEVDTEGLTSPALDRRQWRGLPRPVYPLDEHTSWSPPVW